MFYPHIKELYPGMSYLTNKKATSSNLIFVRKEDEMLTLPNFGSEIGHLQNQHLQQNLHLMIGIGKNLVYSRREKVIQDLSLPKNPTQHHYMRY